MKARKNQSNDIKAAPTSSASSASPKTQFRKDSEAIAAAMREGGKHYKPTIKLKTLKKRAERTES